MKEKNIQELAIRMGLISVENMCKYNITQLVVMVANKVNELVGEVWRFETDVQEILKTQNENIQYLLGEGLHLEIENIFDGWVKDGTFDTLINQTALKQVNDRIDETNDQLSQKVSMLDGTCIIASHQGLLLEEKAAAKNSLYDNKFDKNTVTIGYFNQPDGTISNSSHDWITPKLNVECVKSVIVTNPVSKPIRLNEYDKEGNFIKNTSRTTTELKVQLTNNTQYILLGGNNTMLDTVRMYYVYRNAQNVINGKSYVTIDEKVFNNKSINVEEYEFTDSYTKTKYWITHIPRHDSYGNINELKLGFANNMITGDIFPETTREFANRNNATICINAGVSWESYNGKEYFNKDGQKCNKMHGLRVFDHMLVSNDIVDDWYKKTHWALGITDDGLLVSFGTVDGDGNMTMSYEESQNLGCKYVTSAFTPIMIDGASQKNILHKTNQWVNDDASNIYYQRQIIAQNSATKDIFILTSNGKGTRKNSDGLVIDGGMTLDDCITILQQFGCDFAYQLDEGGSTSLVYKGQLLNGKTDGSGKKERLLSDFLYVATTPTNDRDKDILDLQKEIGNLKDRLNSFDKFFFESQADSPIEIQRWVEGSLAHSLNLKGDAIQYYDSKNKSTLFQADKTGLFMSILGTHGYFPKFLSAINNTDFPKYNTVFVYPPELDDAPYNIVKGFVIHLVWGGAGDNQIQIAFPYATVHDSVHHPKYRTRTIKNGVYSWNEWNSLGQPTT